MQRVVHLLRHVSHGALIGTGCSMLTVAGLLLSYQAHTVRVLRDEAIPLVATLPSLEHRLEVLTEQVDIAELQSSMQRGSINEFVRVYVVPQEPDLDRLIATMDVVLTELQRSGALQNPSAITFGEPSVDPDDGRLARQPLSMEVSIRDDGAQALLSVVQLAGVLTVGDALTDEERALLLGRTEEENPAGIVAIEQFLSTDLLRYARDTRSYEDQVLRSFSSPAFTNGFTTVLQSPLLRAARQYLSGPIGSKLDQQHLWPVPMLVVASADFEAGQSVGWYKLSLTLHLITRKAEVAQVLP